jgi:hypothetical protein
MYEGGNPVERAQMLKIDNQKTGVLTEHELNRLMEILEARAIEENAAFSLHPLCRYPFFYTDCKPLPEKRGAFPFRRRAEENPAQPFSWAPSGGQLQTALPLPKKSS